MSTPQVFDYEIPLPDEALGKHELSLLGFEAAYEGVKQQLRLLLQVDELDSWSKTHHGRVLPVCELVTGQYPLILFHGDVGTGKTAFAECISNRLARESGVEDTVLFKLSNQVRGSGKVGEMGSLISDAFETISQSAGRTRRAIVLLDEGDSVAASRDQEHSHHEDKVAVNTLIQCIDQVRRMGGRVVVFLCTNRLRAVDPAILRRAAVVKRFERPDSNQRRALFSQDLEGLSLADDQIDTLVSLTGKDDHRPSWTYSDIRTRLYPVAMGKAFPHRPLTFDDLMHAAQQLEATPRMAST